MPTEAERVEAIRQILIQIYTLLDAGLPGPHVSRIEREAIYFLYESVGVPKFAESRPHSAAARAIRKSLPGPLDKSVTYDHAIPLATLREGLKQATISRDALHAFLRRYVLGVVLTRDENLRLNKTLRRTLPRNADAHDMLARYRTAGILFDHADETLLIKNLETD